LNKVQSHRRFLVVVGLDCVAGDGILCQLAWVGPFSYDVQDGSWDLGLPISHYRSDGTIVLAI